MLISDFCTPSPSGFFRNITEVDFMEEEEMERGVMKWTQSLERLKVRIYGSFFVSSSFFSLLYMY